MATIPDQTMMPPPGVDYGDWLDAQRLMGLAGTMQQESMTPTNIQQYGRVAARVSPLSGVSKLLEAYLGKKTFQKGAALTAQNYANALEAMGGQSSAPSSVAPSNGALSAPTSASQQTQATQWNPQGLPPQVALRLYQSDPKAYAEYLRGPESVQLARLSGQNPQQAAAAALSKTTQPEPVQLANYAGADPSQAAMAALQKQSTEILRPGATMMNFLSNKQIIGADPARGEYYVQGPNGKTYAYPIENEAEVAALRAGGISGAETAGRVANTPQAMPNKSGGTTFGYPADVGLTPPALRTQAPSAPNTQPKSYFPPRPPVTTSPQPQAQDPFPGAPTASQAGGLGAPGTTSEELMKGRATQMLADQKKYGGESDLADQQLVRIQEAERVLAGSNTGPWSKHITEMQGILHEVAPSVFSGEAATNTQIFNKNAVNNALIGAKGIYGPRMTSQEVMLQKNEANPSTEQTQEAIKYLLNQQKIVAQYQRQRAKDYQSWIGPDPDHPLHDPIRFEGWYSANKPLQQFALRNDTARQAQLAADQGKTIPQAAFDRLLQHPEMKEGFVRQFGYAPPGF